jgi:peroxiredoxin
MSGSSIQPEGDPASEAQSLNARLRAYRDDSAKRRPEFTKAYDELIARLAALERDEIGPKVGEPLPPFRLPDEQGRLVSLESLVRQGPVVVSFNRGHWCPYCRLDLRALAAVHDRMRGLGARLVSIMPDSGAFTAEYARSNSLPFPVLSDIDLGYALSLGLMFWIGADVQQVYERAGIDLETYHGNAGYFLPMAAKFIVGRDGLVKVRQVDLEFRQRMEPSAILAALEALAAVGDTS